VGRRGRQAIRLGRTDGGNLRGQADLDHVAHFAALHEAQDTARDEAAHGPAHRVVRETSTASEPRDREAQAKPSLESAMAEEMRINDAVGGGEAETRRKKVLELFPHACGVGLFDFHFRIRK
jgi:hypothetical protein